MPVKPIFASEYWTPVFCQERLFEYGGQYFCPVNPPSSGGGTNIISMVKSVDAGIPSTTNAGITWREVDGPGRPDETWSYFYPGVSTLDSWSFDRYEDVVYLVVVRRYAGSDMELQVGSFDLATELWGPKGTDDGTNPLYFGANEDISGVQVKALGVDDLFITYHVNDVTGIGTGTQIYYGVRYNTGTWGTPFEIGTTGDPVAYNTHVSGIQQAHKQGTDYIHFVWLQESGATGSPPPNDANISVYTQPYTISTNTLGAEAIVDTVSPITHSANAAPVTMQNTFTQACIFGDLAFLSYNKPLQATATDRASNKRYLSFDATDAIPTFNDGQVFNYLARYTVNRRIFIDNDGRLIASRSEFNDYAGFPVNPDFDETIEPQIVYQVWDEDTSTWGEEQVFYLLAQPALLPRTNGFVPPPYSLIVDDVRTYYPYGSGFGSTLSTCNTCIGPSASTGTGFSALCAVTFVTDDIGYPTSGVATYFFTYGAPTTTSNNVMFFGL